MQIFRLQTLQFNLFTFISILIMFGAAVLLFTFLLEFGFYIYVRNQPQRCITGRAKPHKGVNLQKIASSQGLSTLTLKPSNWHRILMS